MERVPRYKRQRVRAQAYFDRRSLHVVQQGTHKLIVGCPRGFYDPLTKHYGKASEVQAVLHPLNEQSPCDTCQRVAMGWRF